MRNIMKNKNIVLIILLGILINTGIYATPTVIEISTEFVADEFRAGEQIYLRNDKLYSSSYRTNSDLYYIEDDKRIALNPDTESFKILGEQEEYLIINRYNGGATKPKTIYFLNPENDTYIDFPYKETVGSQVVGVNHYLGSQYFITERNGESYDTKLVTLEGNQPDQNISTYLCDISDDKQNLLIASYQLRIYNLFINKGHLLLKNNDEFTEFEIPSMQFINNEYLMFCKSDRYNVYSVCDIEGKEVLRIQYVDGVDISKQRFRKIKDSEYGYFQFDDALYRTIGEREALEDFGILFRQTTGNVNDDRVRVRNLPLVDYGEHLGFLNKGDELEILDRGGLKVQIGEMNDYWFKVRRTSDGLEGWAYGYFIDVNEPPEKVDDGSLKPYRILERDPSIPIK